MVPIPKLLKSLVLTSLWAASAAFPQSNPVYNVDSPADEHDVSPGNGECKSSGGTCTLRAAIEENNLAPGWGTINIPEGHYILTQGPLTITGDATLQGAGWGSTRIDGNKADRVLLLDGPSPYNVWINNLEITGGKPTNSIGSESGGGIKVNSGDPNVSLYRVRITDNEAEWQGGGIQINGGSFYLTECVVDHNRAPRSDGTGQEGNGGGIWNLGNLYIRSSSISANEGTRGAGILNGGRAEIVNSTLSGNLATKIGGAIANFRNGNILINFSTLTKNEVGVAPEPGRQAPSQYPFGGGGVYNAGHISVANSIVADNKDHRGRGVPEYSPDCWSKTYDDFDYPENSPPVPVVVHPTWNSERRNILGSYNSGICNANDFLGGGPVFDQFGSDMDPLLPMLGDLSLNGGITTSHVPLAGSPAIDNGNVPPNDFGHPTGCPEFDQRGVPRPPSPVGGAGTGCDIGAAERTATTGAMEAEDAESHGAFVKSSHADASGGWYMATANVLPGDPNGDQLVAPHEDHRLRFTFYIDENGFYELNAWAHALAPNDNSFWVRIDDEPATLWDVAASGPGTFTQYLVGDRGDGTEANPEFSRIVPYLTKGMHTLDVYLRETGTWLDKVQFVPAGSTQLDFEAESMAMRLGAFMIGNDAAAHGGQYIAAPPAFSGAVTAPDPAHKAVFTLQAPQAGTYLLRANVHAVMDNHNSFWVKVDGGTPYLWDMSETNTRYGLDYLSHRGNGDSRDPEIGAVELALAAGSHTVEVFAREGDTRLDRIGLELKSDAEARIVSRNKTMHASSSQNSSYGPEKAVDGNAATRWSSLAGDNQWIKVDLGGIYDVHRVVLSWEAAYGRDYALQISNDAENWTDLYLKEDGNGGVDDWTVQGRGRYVRMLGLARGTQYGYSLYEFTVYGEPAVGGTINIAQGKVATVSSAQTAEFAGSKAVDGNAATRWSSNFNDYEWIWVDLGYSREISRVKLTWEAAFGRGYEILVSDDASAWTPAFTTTTGNGGTDDLSVSGRGRYVKMRGVQRGTSWGYSLYEFAVFGK